MSDNNLGLSTLENCQEQVTFTIRNNLDNIAQFLRNKKIIDRKMYKKITNVYKSEDDRAGMIFQKLCDKVQEDCNIYEMFVKHIRGYPDSGAKKTVAMLDERYKEIESQGKTKFLTCCYLIHDSGAENTVAI